MSNDEIISLQRQRVAIEQELCQARYQVKPLAASVCPLTWDGLMCWPETPAGTQAILPCASYIDVFDKNGKFVIQNRHSVNRKFYPIPIIGLETDSDQNLTQNLMILKTQSHSNSLVRSPFQSNKKRNSSLKCRR